MLTPSRITLAAQTADHANGSRMLPNVQVEYSSISAFNCDNTRLLLLHFSYFALYTGDGKYLFDCTEDGRFTVSARTSPRWSATDPNVFTYFSANQIREYNIQTRASRELHIFGEYKSIDDKGEADLAEDGRCRVLCGDNKEIFVFNLQTGSTGAKLATEGHPWNNLYIAPDSGALLVGWSEYGTGPFQGIWLYTWDLSERRNLAPVLGHMDIGRDVDGSAVMIWASSADRTPICGFEGTGIVKIPLNGNKPTCITTFPWAFALHISCPLQPLGEFFISTYGVGPGAIYRSSMKPGDVEKLIGLQQIAAAYEQEPKVSCSRDGSKIVFIEGEDVWMADLTNASQPTPVASEPSTLEPTTKDDATMEVLARRIVDRVLMVYSKEYIEHCVREEPNSLLALIKQLEAKLGQASEKMNQ